MGDRLGVDRAAAVGLEGDGVLVGLPARVERQVRGDRRAEVVGNPQGLVGEPASKDVALPGGGIRLGGLPAVGDRLGVDRAAAVRFEGHLPAPGEGAGQRALVGFGEGFGEREARGAVRAAPDAANALVNRSRSRGAPLAHDHPGEGATPEERAIEARVPRHLPAGEVQGRQGRAAEEHGREVPG